jgi:hypothetical protein
MPRSAQPPEDEPPEVAEAKREFARRLGLLRVNAGFATLKDLADASDVGYTTVKTAVAGGHLPNFNTVAKLARACRTRAGADDRRVKVQADQLLTDWKAVNEVVDRASARYGTQWPAAGVAEEANQHGGMDSRAEPETNADPAVIGGPAEAAGHLIPATEQATPSTLRGNSDGEPPVGSYRTWVWVAALLGLIVLALIAVVIVQQLPSGDDDGTGGSSPSTPSPGRVEVPIRFNALGGTSSRFIRVFAGVTKSAADRRQTGTFPDKEVAMATCKKPGRPVPSDTSAGEEQRDSNMWVLLATPSSEPMYATLTYADVTPENLAKLPTCP